VPLMNRPAILHAHGIDGRQVGGNGPSGEIGIAGAIDGNGGDRWMEPHRITVRAPARAPMYNR